MAIQTTCNPIYFATGMLLTGMVLANGLAIGTTAADTTKSTPYDRLAIKRQLTPMLEAKQLALGAPLFIRIFKETAELEVWLKDKTDRWQLYRNYPICYFSGNLGPKLKEGDQQSPEGFYKVSRGLMNPNSKYHLSFNLGFPNRFDRANGRTGSYLMVHGNCVSIGCYAMTDAKIEEIFTLANAAFKKGQKRFQVHVFPFRMTDTNMERFSDSQWLEFWQNLKQGYDFFETHRQVPKISVSEKKYVFEQM